MIGQNNFSRSLWNDSKLGAYYTDIQHCSRIGRLFSFKEETCCLEPSFGDVSALEALLDSAHESHYCCTFGVEINSEVYKKAQSKLDYSINADFLNGTRISNKVFTFCFANPPYASTGDDGKDRLESKFVERIFSLLKPGGFLALVVSYPTMQIEKFSKCLLARFSCEIIYRFDDAEYSKFKQIVFIGKRKTETGFLKNEYDNFMAKVDIALLPYLPMNNETLDFTIEVPGSQQKEVELFTTREFHPEAVGESLNNSALFPTLERSIFQSGYYALDIGRPILPLKKDLLYLCAVAGGGQGLVGREETADLHLQRGVAKRVERSSIEYDESGENEVEVIQYYTEISLNIIDNDGNIRELK